jgi:hypothetical protein
MNCQFSFVLDEGEKVRWNLSYLRREIFKFYLIVFTFTHMDKFLYLLTFPLPPSPDSGQNLFYPLVL